MKGVVVKVELVATTSAASWKMARLCDIVWNAMAICICPAACCRARCMLLGNSCCTN